MPRTLRLTMHVDDSPVYITLDAGHIIVRPSQDKTCTLVIIGGSITAVKESVEYVLAAISGG